VDKVSQKTTTPPGEVERLSISVLVNDRTEMRDGKTNMVPRSREELAKLEELVKRAVGFNVERGDSLRVDSAPFFRSEFADVNTVPVAPAWRRYLPYAIGLSALIVLALVVLVWRKKRAKRMALLVLERERAQRVALELNGAGGTAAATMLAGASTAQLPGSQQLDAPARRARALQMANEDPATAAIVIRKWLNATPNAAATARL
jgi:flagellar M-ring protein FliF